MSYEICLITFVFFPLFCVKSFDFSLFVEGRKKAIFCLLIGGVFFFLFLCETNRAPFDFAEGERELVSGFKIEYRGLSFAFLFLGEYGNILFASGVLRIFFSTTKFLFLPLISIFVRSFFLLVRGRFPRFRFDLLMSFCWGILLLVGLFLFFSYFVV